MSFSERAASLFVGEEHQQGQGELVPTEKKEYYGKFNAQVPTETYGHEGDNLGGTTQFLYVPANDTYIFIQLNVGKQLWGKYFMRVIESKQRICRYVARYRKP